MNKKSIIFVFALVLILVFVLGGCNKSDSKEEHFANLLDKGNAFDADYYNIINQLNSTESYSYTATFYSERLSNFDTQNRMMPQDKTPSQNKKWEKINKEVNYIKNGDSEYISVKAILPIYDDNNLPAFSDKDSKKPIYADELTTEIWLSKGNIIYVKENGILVEDINLYISEDYRITFIDNTPSALFSGAQRKWFGETIKTAQYYYLNESETIKIPYSQSKYASGYGEDTVFDWQNIQSVDISNVGLTIKKQKLTKLEMYTERISSHSKNVTQVWNNQTVTNWYGNRTQATKTIVNYTYPDSKNWAAIPKAV